MNYYISRTIQSDFDLVVEKVRFLLKEAGFGVLTEIDVQKTLKQKLDVEFKKYLILGACNPPFAYKAFQAEDKIGILLPCNVIIIDQGNGNTEVAIMDPVAMMSQLGNPGLEKVASEVTKLLSSVLKSL